MFDASLCQQVLKICHPRAFPFKIGCYVLRIHPARTVLQSPSHDGYIHVDFHCKAD